MTPNKSVQKKKWDLFYMKWMEMMHMMMKCGSPKSNSDRGRTSLDEIAAVVRPKIWTGIELVEYKLTAMGVTFDDMSGSKGFFKHLDANFYVSLVFFHVLFSRTVAGELETI